MDRAHRIGQKKVVNVYRLIMRNTLEEKIMGYIATVFCQCFSSVQLVCFYIYSCSDKYQLCELLQWDISPAGFSFFKVNLLWLKMHLWHLAVNVL